MEVIKIRGQRLVLEIAPETFIRLEYELEESQEEKGFTMSTLKYIIFKNKYSFAPEYIYDELIFDSWYNTNNSGNVILYLAFEEINQYKGNLYDKLVRYIDSVTHNRLNVVKTHFFANTKLNIELGYEVEFSLFPNIKEQNKFCEVSPPIDFLNMCIDLIKKGYGLEVKEKICSYIRGIGEKEDIQFELDYRDSLIGGEFGPYIKRVGEELITLTERELFNKHKYMSLIYVFYENYIYRYDIDKVN